MKPNLKTLLPLALVAAGAFVAPAHAQIARPDTMQPRLPATKPAIVQPRLPATAPAARPTTAPATRPLYTQAARLQTTSSDPNYIGVGGSNDGVVVNGRYGLSNNFSVRPEVFTNARGDNNGRGESVLLPITYDFNTRTGSSTGPAQNLHPFLGVGPGVTTGDGTTNAQLVATAGADYRLSNRYSADASVNYLPFDNERTDFVAGVGYNF